MRNALHDLRSVHRLFLKYNVTTWSLGLLPSLWRAYFDFGQPRVVVNERGRFQLDTTIPDGELGTLIGPRSHVTPKGNDSSDAVSP